MFKGVGGGRWVKARPQCKHISGGGGGLIELTGVPSGRWPQARL